MQKDSVLKMQNITKTFPGVVALKDACLEVKKGEVHSLMGENGAGKSTLVKVLGGIHRADEGEIFVENQKVDITSVIAAEKLGISIIHQEISLVNSMSVAENIFLGREPENKAHFYDRKACIRMAQEVLDRMKLSNINPEAMVGTLSIAEMQMVEIARALAKNPKIMVMDEPTASLTDKEVQSLFACIRELQQQNVAIIYISHRMDEVFYISDRITVFRDSRYIGTKEIGETSQDEIIHMMVGRELTEMYAGEIRRGTDEIAFEVKNFKNRHLKDVSFHVRKGEVFGISGLVGAKRTELARAIFGIDKLDSGEMFLNGKRITVKSTEQAIKQGISLVPEDRKKEGLVLIQSIEFNITISILDRFIHYIFHNKKKEEEFVEESIETLTIKTPSAQQYARNLSGGNQQKVVIAKWLATNPDLLILDEPTRGVDVGAKAEIYHLINEIASKGVAVIMISSDLPEVINMSSRIGIMHEGRMVKVLDSKADDISQNNIMFYATGGRKE